jgi:hypothetical protein
MSDLTPYITILIQTVQKRLDCSYLFKFPASYSILLSTYCRTTVMNSLVDAGLTPFEDILAIADLTMLLKIDNLIFNIKFQQFVVERK